MSSFQTVDGRPLRNHYMNVMFTRHGRKAGVSQVNPHRFRHTFATWAIRASARELDVQYLLGHSSPMMVGRYSACMGHVLQPYCSQWWPSSDGEGAEEHVS